MKKLTKEDSKANPESKTTILIPRNQFLSGDELRNLFERIPLTGGVLKDVA